MMKKIGVLITTLILLTSICVPVNAANYSLNQSKITMNVGDSFDIDVIGSNFATWTTTNKNIAPVDNNGIVTAKATGKATIKARIGSETMKCSVNIVGSSVTLNKKMQHYM